MATAAALFAVAILLIGAGSGDPEAAQRARQAARLIALVSAVGYLMAFAPPAWARAGLGKSGSRLVDVLATARAQLAAEQAGMRPADTDRLRTELAIHAAHERLAAR